MKCIKNVKTGNVIRVDDRQAHQMVGNTWQYTSKSEWKELTRNIVKETTTVVDETATIAEKQRNRKKNKK
jgi:hypothetical protein